MSDTMSDSISDSISDSWYMYDFKWYWMAAFSDRIESEDDKKRGGWCESLYANIMIT